MTRDVAAGEPTSHRGTMGTPQSGETKERFLYGVEMALEVEDDSGREPQVILRVAAEIRHQIIALDNAPVKAMHDFRIEARADGHRKGRVAESRRADVRATNQYVRKGRNARRQGHLRAKQVGVHRCIDAGGRTVMAVEIGDSPQPVGELVLAGNFPAVQIGGRRTVDYRTPGKEATPSRAVS